ncbi:MAG: APC family permease [Clostridium sp.]|nr:APC family permease [Clostridium sp.]
MKEKGYGLFTTIAMIIGVVIGSGIFFKSDNILVATNGSIALGVLVFCIAAIAIIFGSLTISELAARNSDTGGLIAYAEQSYNKAIACAFGWFQTFLYFPTLIAIVAYVAGIYICLLFGIEGSLELQVLLGLIVIVMIYLLNAISSKLGGIFQSTSTIIKLIPLIIFAIAGIILGEPKLITSELSTAVKSTGWIAAIAPIAFSFDGWVVSTTVGNEVRDSKKNLPKALVIAPISILIVYLLYFVGISIYIGPETIMSLGDSHVDLVANNLFGVWGSKIILVFVIISIIGTVNGLIMGLIRLPYSLAIRNMFPKSEVFSEVNEKNKMPINSVIISFLITVTWLVVHYFTTKTGILLNSDISEISITISYVLYALLYVKVLQLGINKEIKSTFRGIINPILALCGSAIILFGSIGNSLFWIYALICLVILLSAVMFWRSVSENQLSDNI